MKSSFNKQLALMFLLVVLTACAGLAKMTPNERALTFCDDFMTQYESLHAQSAAVLKNEKVGTETKVFVATVINPKLNRLQTLIIDYCQLSISGKSPSPEAITGMIGDITALFAGVHK